MAKTNGGDRHSAALIPDLISDPTEKARKEAANGLRQFDTAVEAIDAALSPERSFKLRPSLILHLHRTALDEISSYAGNWRPGPVEILKSRHVPPAAHLVPELIEDMCDYVNSEWSKQSAIELSAYVMWRLNWIHPFTDGNGRTARTLAYVILCVRLATRLPGVRTIPDQIADNKGPYYEALEAADEALRSSGVDVSVLSAYLGDLLANQLVSIHEDAINRPVE